MDALVKFTGATGATPQSASEIPVSAANPLPITGLPGPTGPAGPTGPTGPAGPSGGINTNGGRLTLTSGTPVLTGDATAQGTIYYDTYAHNQLLIGTTLYVITADEISLVLDTSNHLSTHLYDVFAIVHSAAPLLVTGPAWTSATARSSALKLANGVWVNAAALTHAYNNAVDYGSIAIGAATYLGTFYATANGQTGMAFNAAAAAGGSNAFLGLWNAYNRVLVSGRSQDSSASWTSATAWGPADRGATGSGLNNRVSYVDGLAQSGVDCAYQTVADGITATAATFIGLNLDSSSATPGIVSDQANSSDITVIVQQYFSPVLGFHYIQAMDGDSGTHGTFRGTNGGAQTQQLKITLQI